MGYTNVAIVMGTIESELDLKSSKGLNYCRFKLKTNCNNEAIMHNILCTGDVAENIVKYCKKGVLIYVCGRIDNFKYNNKDGRAIYWSELVADDIQYCTEQDPKNDASDIPPC